MAGNKDSARVRAMAGHVRALCDYHGIRLRRRRKGLAVYESMTVYARPVRSDVTYAEALHEIGHLLGAWQDSGVIVSEAGAWLWAMRNALEWTPAMDRAMAKWLGSYIETQHEHPASDGVPAPGHPAWKVLRKAGAEPTARVPTRPPRGASAASSRKVRGGTQGERHPG